MRLFNTIAALATIANLPSLVQSRAVFAHYMVGTVTEDHAHTDVDDAIAMGLDGFILNVGYPQASFVYPTLLSIYGYTEYLLTQGKNFHLIISMDLWAAGEYKHADGTNVNAFDYGDLFNQFLYSTASYMYGGKYMITTFSDGGMSNADFIGWKQTLNNDVYFVPDLDGTNGILTSDTTWWDYWGSVFDGVATWEYAWPVVGSGVLGSVANDNQVITGGSTGSGTAAHSKTYLAPLSAVQYKNAYGTNLYRAGGLNLIDRMINLNAMATMADWVDVITWNDGPESHYIGNIWPESNGDPAPALYVSSTKSPHTGWQAVVSSFITAFKNGDRSISQWRTRGANPSNSAQVGAIWYKTIRTTTSCPSDTQPAGYSVTINNLDYAVISNVDGLTLKYAGQTRAINTGLNYGEFTVNVGTQRVELWNGNALVMVANGGRCNYATCPDGIYNLNPEVVSFKTSWGSDTTC